MASQMLSSFSGSLADSDQGLSRRYDALLLQFFYTQMSTYVWEILEFIRCSFQLPDLPQWRCHANHVSGSVRTGDKQGNVNNHNFGELCKVVCTEIDLILQFPTEQLGCHRENWPVRLRTYWPNLEKHSDDALPNSKLMSLWQLVRVLCNGCSYWLSSLLGIMYGEGFATEVEEARLTLSTVDFL